MYADYKSNDWHAKWIIYYARRQVKKNIEGWKDRGIVRMGKMF